MHLAGKPPHAHDTTSGDTPLGRRERAATTRAAILTAAREAFSRRSYDDVGLRDIAARAGVTAAMVNRCFGTKEALSGEALGTHDPTPAQPRHTAREDFGQTLATLLLGGQHHPDPTTTPHDPLVLLLRSAGSPTARPALHAYVEHHVLPGLTNYFDASDEAARERAVPILALVLVLGTNVLGPVLGVAPLTPTHDNPALQRILTAVLQAAAES